MPDVYSPALLIALVGAGLRLLTAAAGRWGGRGSAPLAGWMPPRAKRLMTLASLVALGVALLSHVALGHRPGSEMALSPVEFFAVHPAILVVATMLVLARLLEGPHPGPADGPGRLGSKGDA